MPAIVDVPTITRQNSRGMKVEEAQEYVDLLNEVETGQGVSVDNADSDSQTKSYARAERVKNAILKFELMDEGTVGIRTYKTSENGEDEAWTASLVKRAPKAAKSEE